MGRKVRISVGGIMLKRRVLLSGFAGSRWAAGAVFGLLVAVALTLSLPAWAAGGDWSWTGVTSGGQVHALSRPALDPFGDAYLAGIFSGTVDFDPGPGTVSLTASGTSQAFLLKLTGTGGLVRATAFGNSETVPEVLAVDRDGSLYVGGYFAGPADLDPGPGVQTLTGGSHGEVFALKLDRDGHLQWARGMGASGETFVQGGGLDGAGNLVLVGEFYGTADFDPGPGTYSASGNLSAFVLKLSPDGNLVWIRTLGNYTVPNAVEVDTEGAIFLAGYLIEATDVDPGAAQHNLTPIGYGDAYMMKLDAQGRFQWAGMVSALTASTNGGVPLVTTSIATDGTGGAFVAGYYEQAADLDPGPGMLEEPQPLNRDMFVLHLGADGGLAWAKTFHSTAQGEAYAANLGSDSTGGVYVTGLFRDVVDFDPGSGVDEHSAFPDEPYVLKLDASGNHVWFAAPSISGAWEWRIDGCRVYGDTLWLSGPITPIGAKDGAPSTVPPKALDAWNAYVAKVDTGDISVTFSSPTPASTQVTPIPVSVTFETAVTGFGAADLAVTGGTISGFTGSGASYYFSLVPSGEGRIHVSLGGGVAHDTAGNGNLPVSFDRAYDVTAPQITLRGLPTVYVVRGDAFADSGFMATDAVDGDITSRVVVDASGVDTETLGDYTVVYTVTDSAGNVTRIERPVEVVDTLPLPMRLAPYALAALIGITGVLYLRGKRQPVR